MKPCFAKGEIIRRGTTYFGGLARSQPNKWRLPHRCAWGFNFLSSRAMRL